MNRAGRLLAIGFGVLSLATLSAPAHADEFNPAQRAAIIEILRGALKSDPSILRDAAEALLDDDDHKAKAALDRQLTQQQDVLLHDPADPVAGNPHGAVTVVEFYDTRCPYCRQMMPVLAELLARNHDVRVVYKVIPILGPPSMQEAQALVAAQRQDGYLRLQEALMQSDHKPTLAGIEEAAARQKLDVKALLRDMDAPETQSRLQANLALSKSLGITGTPTLVIGRQLRSGAVDLAELESMVSPANV